jgi:hypothetical protein
MLVCFHAVFTQVRKVPSILDDLEVEKADADQVLTTLSILLVGTWIKAGQSRPAELFAPTAAYLPQL